jgi:octaprenyl-diphosphate synthase
MTFPKLAQTFSAKEVQGLVRAELGEVEQEIALESISAVEAVNCISDYLRQSGGKRIRPVLLLLAAKMLGESTRLSVKLAAVVEMIHSATLIHDDVIDEAATRRGRASVNAVWGNTVSVLSGDWLYMQAFQISLRERNFRLLDILISLTQTMVEGELLQLNLLGKADVPEADYMGLVDRKTASLFSACAKLGALSVGQNGAIEHRLGEFGWNLGMAFQLVDDLLDYQADERILGKPVGGDLREGKVTLPLIYAMETGGPALRAAVDRILRDGGYRNVAFADVRALIARHGGFDRASARARQFADTARDILNEFPSNPYQLALLSVVDLVVDRDA